MRMPRCQVVDESGAVQWSGSLHRFLAANAFTAADAAKDLGSKLGAFALGYNGNGAALVRFNSGHEVLAVIMPWREDSPEAPPAWVDENPLDVGRVLDREEAHAMAIAEEKRRAKHQLIEEPIEEPERLAA